MQITYNNAGEIQGVSYSKTDSNFTQAINDAAEIINQHPFYFTTYAESKNWFIIGKKIGHDSIMVRVRQITGIDVTDETITIYLENFSISIYFNQPQFLIH
jgi:hypothetical protein